MKPKERKTRHRSFGRVSWSVIPALSTIAVLGCGPDVTQPTGPDPSFAAQAHGPVPTYRAVDLGTLGGDYSVAYDINEAGQVVGISGYAPGVGAGHAFLWQNGTMTDLGTLHGGSSSANGINDAGQVVGESDNRAFLWQNGVMTDLGVLGGCGVSTASSINSIGQVVGTSTCPAGGNAHAFLWQNGTMTDLGTLDGLATTNSGAADINDSGQIVGFSGAPGSDAHAFLWQSGVMTDLGTLGGTWGIGGLGINNAGEVAGQFSAIGHAFLWQAGMMTDLGTLRRGLFSWASDLNDAGQVAATSFDPSTNSGGYHAALWQDGTMVDLGPQRADASFAFGINELGQIVGFSLRGVENHAVMWVKAGRPFNPGAP